MSEPLRILFCDDSGGAQRGFQREVAEPLGDAVELCCVSSVEGFRETARSDAFDLVVSDLNFEQVGGGPKDGLLILREAHISWPDAEILLLTAHAGSLNFDEGLELAAQGLKPDLFHKTGVDDPAELWQRLRERVTGMVQARVNSQERVAHLERQGSFYREQALKESLRACAASPVDRLAEEIRADAERCSYGIVGRSFGLRQQIRKLERAASRESSVLIMGETGTGKELIAQALHRCSARKDQPLVKTDLAALSKELIAAELFGHEKGAFTGAQGSRKGLVGEADGGVLFFDEIGNLGADVQAGLLRLLEDRTYRPLGGSSDRKVDVMVVAATHEDLEQEVVQGNFRADLLERLCIVPLELPPLRERREDIPLLAVCFLAELRQRFGVPGFDQFDLGALELLVKHPWPRNVRQLRNSIERLFSELDDNVSPITAEAVAKVLPAGPREVSVQESLAQRVLAGEDSATLAELARRYGEDAVRELIIETFLAFRGPPDDEQALRLFGGMKAATWRQYAFKRGLTYKAIKAGEV